MLLAALAQRLEQRVFLVVAPLPAAAERWLADLDVLAGNLARLYPQREALGEEEPHLEIAGERVETIEAVLTGRARIVVTTLRATAEHTRMPSMVTGMRAEIRKGHEVRLSWVVERLEAMSYERRPSVLDAAQFAVRGGIIDVYGFGMAAPTRIEWWGDEPVSIRSFDLDTQRSEGEVGAVTILPVGPGGGGGEGAGGEDRQTLLGLLPDDTVVVVDPAVDYEEVGRVWQDAAHHIEVARRRGEDVPGREAVFLSPEEWGKQWRPFAKLELERSPIDHDLKLQPPPSIERKMGRLARVVGEGPTLILCDNEGQLERLEELLGGDGSGVDRLPPMVTLALGSLGGGFATGDLTVLTDHEIFLPTRPSHPPAAALSPGAQHCFGRLPDTGRLRGPPGAWDRGLSRDRDDHGR